MPGGPALGPQSLAATKLGVLSQVHCQGAQGAPCAETGPQSCCCQPPQHTDIPEQYILSKYAQKCAAELWFKGLLWFKGVIVELQAGSVACSSVAGYVGNWAGPIGAAAAMAVGMFDTVTSVASQPTGVWDVVPADLVASSILAAAAAVSAGAAAAISQATQSGTVQGTAAERRVVLGYPHPLSAAVRAPQLLGQGGGQAAGDVASKIIAKVQLNATAQASVAVAPPHDGMDTTAARDQHNDQHSDQQSDQHSNQHSALYRSNSSGSSSGSPRLLATAVHDGKSEGLTSSSSASSSVVECEVDGEQQQQGGMPLLILHAATSSTYPLVLMESWNYMLDFLEAHPAPFRYVVVLVLTQGGHTEEGATRDGDFCCAWC